MSHPDNDSSTPVTSVVATEAARLCEKWRKFQESCPKEDQLDLQQYEPTVESMVQLVTAMQNKWRATRETGRRAIAVQKFHQFCGSLDAHSNLLKLLPEGNEYVSLFSGTLTSIIKVGYCCSSRFAID